MFSTENRDTRWTKKDTREHGLNVTRVGWSGIVSVGYWCSRNILLIRYFFDKDHFITSNTIIVFYFLYFIVYNTILSNPVPVNQQKIQY